MNRRTMIALAGAALLSACSTTLPENVREQRGRFSLRVTGGSRPAEQWTGRFTLRTAPDHLRLDLLTPLSGILARVEATPRGATFARGIDDIVAEGPTPEALMTEVLGFSLPVSVLEAWLDGRPGPDAAPADAWEAQGWRVAVGSRTPDGRPMRLTAETRQNGTDLRLTLVLDTEA